MSLQKANLRLPLLAMGVGCIVAVSGIGLLKLIALITNLSFHGKFSVHEGIPDFSTWGTWAILVPALGGLVIGLLARYGSPEIRGHGIPETMQGVVMNQSKIPLKVAILKPFSAALSIGTGGPFGAEGPVIAMGGSIGSITGQFLPASAVERKILLAAGAAAGMTVVFGTPLAGVLLAIELLLFEFRFRSLLPVAMASGMAMAVRGWIGEPFPMLPLPSLEAPGLMIATGSILIGIAAGLASVALTHALHRMEHAVEKLPIPKLWLPALGGLMVGLIGWVDHRSLGAGYYNMRALLDGQIMVPALLTLLTFKFLSWSISLSSGTTGGTLAPVMTIGGAVGALMAHGLHHLHGFENFPMGIAALVGMAAIFAGASRAFLTSVAFSFEATHSSTAFGPLLLGCAFAVLVSRLLMKESIMTEKMAQKGVKVPEDYEPDPLLAHPVSSAMVHDPLTIPPHMLVRELADLITGEEQRWHLARLFPIVENSVLLGVISRADVLAAMQAAPETTVMEAGVSQPFTIHADDSLAEAADRMVVHEIGRLPVVDRSTPPVFQGIISRREILQARLHRLKDEARGNIPFPIR